MAELDMDFDLLYSVKTPLFLGNVAQAANELSGIEIDAEDTKNQSLKAFYELRTLAAQGDMAALKSRMKELMPVHPHMVRTLGELIRL